MQRRIRLEFGVLLLLVLQMWLIWPSTGRTSFLVPTRKGDMGKLEQFPMPVAPHGSARLLSPVISQGRKVTKGRSKQPKIYSKKGIPSGPNPQHHEQPNI